MTDMELFLTFTRQDGECRTWTRQIHTHPKTGHRYGRLWSKKTGAYVGYMAHRYFYEAFVGPIQKGRHLHHTCHNSLCCNPSHLQPVTPLEHVAIEPNSMKHRTHCPKGHAYTPENTRIVTPRGRDGVRRYRHRVCVECHRIANYHYNRNGRKAARLAATTTVLETKAPMEPLQPPPLADRRSGGRTDES